MGMRAKTRDLLEKIDAPYEKTRRFKFGTEKPGQASVPLGKGWLSGNRENARYAKGCIHSDKADQDDFDNAHDVSPAFCPVRADRQ